MLGDSLKILDLIIWQTICHQTQTISKSYKGLTIWIRTLNRRSNRLRDKTNKWIIRSKELVIVKAVTNNKVVLRRPQMKTSQLQAVKITKTLQFSYTKSLRVTKILKMQPWQVKVSLRRSWKDKWMKKIVDLKKVSKSWWEFCPFLRTITK